MDRLTLREAAAATSRSLTTLRRYIRSGKLRAELREGRYGPEYFVSPADLAEAGLEPDGPEALVASPAAEPAAPAALERLLRETVPATLFQELQMKHEQLLVQYGMVRAGGMRILELQAEIEARQHQVETCQEEITRLRERLSREGAQLRKRLRESELELEARSLEIAALREKVRGLEMLARNAVTTEAIDRAFAEVVEQARKVERLHTSYGAGRAEGPSRPAETDH